jgi:hypothetical protein
MTYNNYRRLILKINTIMYKLFFILDLRIKQLLNLLIISSLAVIPIPKIIIIIFFNYNNKQKQKKKNKIK